MNLTQCQIYVERTQKHKRAIPPELSFENVIQNKALPPCALQDFMVYTQDLLLYSHKRPSVNHGADSEGFRTI